MQPNELLKYLLDLESAIDEPERIVEIHEQDYQKFSSNFMAVRAVE